MLKFLVHLLELLFIDGLRQLSYRSNLHHFFKRLINPHLAVQAAMLLLIKCGVPKLSYLLRCVPPTCISAYAAEMDGQVLNCASKLLKLSDTDMKKSKIIQQLQSPISYGFGLISAVESSHVAYLSSVVSCLSMKTLKQYLSCSSVSSSSHPTSSPSSLSSSPTEPNMLYQHLEQCIITIKQNLIVLSMEIQLIFNLITTFLCFSDHTTLLDRMEIVGKPLGLEC